MHIPSPPGDPPPLVVITQESLMAMQNNSYIAANGDDDDIGVGNKLNFYPAVDEDYETRRAEQQAESLIPLKEDLAEWIQRLLDIPITTETFIQALDNGAALCRLAFLIQSKAEEACREGKCSETIPRLRFRYRENAKSRTWYARDNTANFLRWCRDFGINEGCMFESEDLVCHRQEKPVVVCLLELARLGYRFGIEPPSIVKIEKEIEREESELASQRNEDEEDLNEGADESAEVGDGEEVEADGNEAETKNEGEEEEEGEEEKNEEKEGEEGGGEGEGDNKDEVDGEGEENEESDSKTEKDEEHIVEIEEKKLEDGMNGNGKEEDSTGDGLSDGCKSRATSQAASHQSGQNDDNDEENAERDKEEDGGGGGGGGGKDEEDGEKEGDEEEEEKGEGENKENGEEEGDGGGGGGEDEEGEKGEEGEEEKDKVGHEEGEGMNGTVNGTGGNENGNENEEDENKESSTENKGVDSRPNSPTKNDSGTTSPSRKSPTNTRSRIDNIKARQLDKKVKHIASEHNVSEHVSQISEGKYCIFGRVVFIRLLKEKHLMVRVGGGWDTLDHYLSHHSPTKILEFKRNDQTKTPATTPRSDPDTGESAAGTNNTGDEKFLVITGKYKRH